MSKTTIDGLARMTGRNFLLVERRLDTIEQDLKVIKRTLPTLVTKKELDEALYVGLNSLKSDLDLRFDKIEILIDHLLKERARA